MTHDRPLPTYDVDGGFEKGVYYVLPSDIPGLNIEAAAYEGFLEAAKDVTPALLGNALAKPAIRFRMTIPLVSPL